MTTSCRVPKTSHDTYLTTLEGKSLTREFISSGIDDLAKYRIVRVLYEQRTLAGDADYFAAYLGFHSVEITATLLEELVAAGLLVRETGRNESGPHYRLANDGEVFRRLIRLYNVRTEQPEHEGVIRSLARRSLEKARARAKQLRGKLPKGHA